MGANLLQVGDGKPRIFGLRAVLDAAERWADGLRTEHGDASLSVYARELIVQTLGRFFEHVYPELRWQSGELVTIDRSLNEGVQDFTWQELGILGEADFIADDADDIPKADIFGKSNPGHVRSIATHFSYNLQEVATANLVGNGLNLVNRKSGAARKLVDERLNRTIARGRPELGFPGMLAFPGQILDAALTGGWLTATAAQIVGDMADALSTMIAAVSGIEVLMPNTVVLPISRWPRLTTLQNSAASDITVLDYLKRVLPMIDNWVFDLHMETASPAGGPAMLMYRKDPEAVQVSVPKQFAFLPEQARGMSFRVNGYMRYGGIQYFQPRTSLLLTGI